MVIALGLVLSLCSITLSFAVEAQQSVKPYRVAVLGLPSPTSAGPARLRQELRDLGYIEGGNIVFDYFWAEGRIDRLPDLATRAVALNPDAIVAFSSDATRAAKQATATIPIIMAQVSDPVGSGFVSSLARPGGNITGVTDFGIELAAKYMELLNAIAPEAARIGVLVSDNPVHPSQVKVIEDVATRYGRMILPVMDSSPEQLEPAFALLAKQNARALIVLGGVTQGAQREKITELAVRARLPTIFPTRTWTVAGGLVSYGPSIPDTFKMTAAYIDKVLKGAKPANLPVQQPTKFELVINLKTAKAIGLTIPPSLLLRADEVVQ
ncbi:MAG: ABC transporter substrate-binding protein [Gemmatimonadales bacterium]